HPACCGVWGAGPGAAGAVVGAMLRPGAAPRAYRRGARRGDERTTPATTAFPSSSAPPDHIHSRPTGPTWRTKPRRESGACWLWGTERCQLAVLGACTMNTEWAQVPWVF